MLIYKSVRNKRREKWVGVAIHVNVLLKYKSNNEQATVLRLHYQRVSVCFLNYYITDSLLSTLHNRNQSTISSVSGIRKKLFSMRKDR